MLPDDQRIAVELHHLQGLSLADVGGRLGRSREAVAGLIFRGLKKLRLRLAHEQEGTM
jgi:RNA polymerase sigma-70 factor (ECF subfamily)